ncbi:MAG: cyclase family protein [Clostridia bacterium]|nr:cyclase family protein [Clostridia bacterium]
MKEIIDLSQKLFDKMPVHPYDEEAIVIQNRFIENDKYSNTKISLGMHTGTHIDAPSHLILGGKGLESYQLSHFMGRACVINVSGKKEITLSEEDKNKIKKSEIVLFYTGYGDMFEQAEYYAEDAPVISIETAEYLVLQKIKIAGMDLPSPDRFPFVVHNILLSKDILIIENLTNLEKLLDMTEFLFMALPIKISAEASITRAIAIIE